MMLSIPATPSASYLAPGFVMTSIFLTVEAGMVLIISVGLLLIMVFGLPFTYTLKSVLPFTFTTSFPSTVTIGTFRSISNSVMLLLSGSSAA
ncbi:MULTISPECIES: hypothetical protein [Prevotellaceae]|uniref:hypothetical protein n=1 Tax=Prevotellaceae TaxID=171552 RepID=UPI0020111D3F|nr:MULTISPECIES: hypothetical protein [Prevotellaceae]